MLTGRKTDHSGTQVSWKRTLPRKLGTRKRAEDGRNKLLLALCSIILKSLLKKPVWRVFFRHLTYMQAGGFDVGN
jgi:hypothetical protein